MHGVRLMARREGECCPSAVDEHRIDGVSIWVSAFLMRSRFEVNRSGFSLGVYKNTTMSFINYL